MSASGPSGPLVVSNQKEESISIQRVKGSICKLATKVLSRCLLVSSATILIANSLDTNQAQQNVGSDMNPDCWTH